MCVSASVTPSARSAAGPTSWMPAYSGPVIVARQQHGPLDPGVAQHLQRRRVVVGDRRPDRACRPPSRCRRCAPPPRGTPPAAPVPRRSAARHRANPRARRRRRAGRWPARRRPPAAWPPAGSRPRPRSSLAWAASWTSACRAHGTPAARSTSFIRGLSRTFSAVLTSMPAMPSASRTCASGTCSCSSAPTSRSTRPICRPRPLTPSAICRGSSASSTRQWPASRLRSVGGSAPAARW